jgi:HEAT repeat protein
MPSPTFNAFYESFFGDPYMAWHDGLDVNSLLALTGDERSEAEKLLLENLADPRCVTGLGYIQTREALPKLREMLPTAGDYQRTRIVAAIWRITRDDSILPEIFGVLKNAATEYDRLDAAVALGDIYAPPVKDALLEALADPDYLVRYNAAEALLRLHGLYLKLDLSKEAIFPDLVSDAPEAHVRFRQWMENLLAGKSMEEPQKQNK